MTQVLTWLTVLKIFAWYESKMLSVPLKKFGVGCDYVALPLFMGKSLHLNYRLRLNKLKLLLANILCIVKTYYSLIQNYME